MTTYIALFSLTDAGVKAAKDSPRRLDAAKKLLTDMGGEMKQFYMVLGDFDFVGVCEAPDDAVMARYVLQLGGLGFVRTKTLKAFPETAYREMPALVGLKPGSRSKPRVRPAAFAQTSATFARFVHRGRDRRSPKHRMGLIVAGACLAHRRSAKAKGLAVASHRAAAIP